MNLSHIYLSNRCKLGSTSCTEDIYNPSKVVNIAYAKGINDRNKSCSYVHTNIFPIFS